MADDSNMGQSPVPGGRLGRYTLESPLGVGGMAAVYRARDDNGTRVAVKVLHPESIKPDEIKRFEREFEALSRMNHPNIVRVYEAGMAEGYPWIAIEFVDGTDLGTIIETWKIKPPTNHFELVERYLRKMCLALQYIHEQGLVHRDIKPTNILIRSDGEAKVADFGGVKDPEATGTQLTIAGQLIGTVAFMAPEQITGEPIDRRTDLYSLGALLYIMLTFRRSIEADSVAGFLARHLTEVPKAPSDFNPNIPRRLEQICQRLLMKDPAQRFQSARQVLQLLDSHEEATRIPLRGRNREMAEWNEQLRILNDGAGGSVALVGQEGSGRSFLLHAMLEQARSQGFNVAFSPGNNLNPVTEMLRDMGEQVNEVPIKKHLRWLAERIRGQAWVLGIDDLHKVQPKMVDAYSRLLRKLVANEGESILLLYSCRNKSRFLEPLMSGTESGLPSEIIQLPPLTRKSVTMLIRDRGLSGAESTILGRRLHSELNGLPAPICQQLAALIDAEWLRRNGEQVIALKSADDLKQKPLPIPLSIRKKLTGRLSLLSPEEIATAEVMAVLERPASMGLLGRALERPNEIHFILEKMVHAGIIRARKEEENVRFSFAHPCTASVIIDGLALDARRSIHHAIARALGKKRRNPDASHEVAKHLHHAGQHADAFRAYIQAAKGMSRLHRHLDVIRICTAAKDTLKDAATDIDPPKFQELSRWMYMLTGEAYLARARWTDALAPLQEAVQMARLLGDRDSIARCLVSLGRTHYRLGRFDHASPLLDEALKMGQPDAVGRAGAVRALGDILVRRGKFEEAEHLWDEALECAKDGKHRDSEARARRGLAHVKVFQQKFTEASTLLDQAEDLLNPDGNPRVRAGVISRSVELDLAAARYGSALYRGESLIELVQNRELEDRFAESFALNADALRLAGCIEDCEKNLETSLRFAGIQSMKSQWMAMLRNARILCDLERYEEVEHALPKPEDLRNNSLDDPSAQLAALRARAMAKKNPKMAIDLCSWVMMRPEPLLLIRQAHICTDVCLAFGRAGDIPAARRAAKKGLKALQGPEFDGLRLELLIAFQRVSPDPRILDAIGQVAKRIAVSLPSSIQQKLIRRPVINSCFDAK